MLFDLLQLASSIRQNMELYSNLQVHEISPQVEQQSIVQDNSFSQLERLDNNQQAPRNKQFPQCKPLDLSLKGTSVVPKRRGKAASKTKTCPHKLQLHLNKNKNELSPEQVKHSAAKLITSSTSPSFCSTQSTGSSSSGSILLDTEVQQQQQQQQQQQAQLSSIPINKQTIITPLQRSRTKYMKERRSSISDEVISSTNTQSATLLAAAVPATSSSHIERRQKHKGIKSHLCLQCGRSFSRSDMLIRHSRLHSGLKPYQCMRCKQVFSRSDHLSTHERTHTGEKPYQCSRCSYSACRRDMITRHMRTHSSALSQHKRRAIKSRNRKSTLISLRSYSPSRKDNEISTSSLDLDIEDVEEEDIKECDISD